MDVRPRRAASDDGERATLIATDPRALFTAEVAEEANIAGRQDRPRRRSERLHFFDPRRARAVPQPSPHRPRPASGRRGSGNGNGESTTGGPRLFAVRSPNPGARPTGARPNTNEPGSVSLGSVGAAVEDLPTA